MLDDLFISDEDENNSSVKQVKDKNYEAIF